MSNSKLRDSKSLVWRLKSRRLLLKQTHRRRSWLRCDCPRRCLRLRGYVLAHHQEVKQLRQDLERVNPGATAGGTQTSGPYKQDSETQGPSREVTRSLPQLDLHALWRRLRPIYFFTPHDLWAKSKSTDGSQVAEALLRKQEFEDNFTRTLR